MLPFDEDMQNACRYDRGIRTFLENKYVMVPLYELFCGYQVFSWMYMHACVFRISSPCNEITDTFGIMISKADDAKCWELLLSFMKNLS